MRNLGDLHDMNYDLEKMCMQAVDRSNGELVDINIEHFGTDELLAYIADTSSHIRRPRLVSCHEVSHRGLCKAAKKPALLEELDISYCSISAVALIVVGRHCPHLKSFKYNKQDRDRHGFTNMDSSRDKAARAIAHKICMNCSQNMHELLHLQLFGNKLTNCGLETILDGCPHLKSFDLRHCSNVYKVGHFVCHCLRIKISQKPNITLDVDGCCCPRLVSFKFNNGGIRTALSPMRKQKLKSSQQWMNYAASIILGIS
ncbi:hypothetical protein SLEP1_g40685 [Rubroshorea leprosula]|uniref:F-box protein n=1 Tax=Rubroshorea leprosula TaxID=152421 RepID=A0AAV5L5J3_9ROSI|nr:hypothetical protein SLEP1_g40685 [Rubroshorea leprosula]